MNIIIRDVHQSTSDNIKAEADRRNISQQELLAELLNQKFGEPPTIWGYIKFDRQGDFDLDSEDNPCPVCDQPAQSWWLQVTSNGEMFRMCQTCATSQ